MTQMLAEFNFGCAFCFSRDQWNISLSKLKVLISFCHFFQTSVWVCVFVCVCVGGGWIEACFLLASAH